MGDNFYIQSLKNIGIDVGLLISGLFGAILLTSKEASTDLRTTLLSIIGGAASANYMTPIVLSIINVDTKNSGYAIAFMLGFLGLKGIEVIINKFFKIAPTPAKQIKKRKKKK